MPSLTAPRTPPAPPLSREDVARIEVGHTTISPAIARVLVAVFVLAIATVSAVELVRLGGHDGPTAWSHLRSLPDVVPTSWVQADGGQWTRSVAANRATLAGIAAFERDLEQQSAIGGTMRPPTQLLLSDWLGAGNERVYVGRDGWLFYRPDVEFVTGPPFLDPRQQARRVGSAPEWETPPAPDPMDAIMRLKLDLDRRGITLLVVPVPVKPTVHPEQLSAAYAGYGAPVQNPSVAPLLEALRREGVLVFDPAPALVDARSRTGDAQYLRTDTHWRPEAMQAVAAGIGQFLEQQAGFRTGTASYRLERARVRQDGDTVQMLDLSPGQHAFETEEVEVERVFEADGTPWRPTRGAEVLVLGDSFSNIYSLDSLGWGVGAGLAEHLSATMQRPVDRLVQNDQGSFATRAMLQRVSAEEPDRLSRTRVVVYQFASREFAQGDWRVLPLPD